MRDRVNNPKQFPTYVGKKVFPEWDRSFEAFKKYVEENLGDRPPGFTLDRINNDGDYAPGNLRWASPKEQARHRRSNTYITVDGVSRTIAEWADVSGLTANVICARRRMGWPDHLAVRLPRRAQWSKNDSITAASKKT